MRHLRREVKHFLDEVWPAYKAELPRVLELALDTPVVEKGVPEIVVAGDESQVRGRPITVSVKVIGDLGAATGEVTLYDQEKALNASTKQLVGGVGTWALTWENPGKHVLTARYSGDTHYQSVQHSNAVLVELV